MEIDKKVKKKNILTGIALVIFMILLFILLGSVVGLIVEKLPHAATSPIMQKKDLCQYVPEFHVFSGF